MHNRTRWTRLATLLLAFALACGTVPQLALASTPTTETLGAITYETEGAYRAANPDAATADRAPALVAQDAYWTRLEGATRYDTMAQISSAAFVNSPWAVIASDNNFPDALAASALAGARLCPVLLAGRYGLPDQTYSELRRLGVTQAYIVGGEAVVGYEVESVLYDMGITPTRVAGTDRQDTSRAVAAELRRMQQMGETTLISDMAIVATGAGFADALSIAPWAFSTGSPILLTKSDGILTDAQVDFVKADEHIKRIIIVGGTSVVNELVKEQLGEYEYERLAGTDRYRTSAEIATWECEHGFGWNGTVLATGQNFPDALTCAAIAGVRKVPLLLGDDVHQASFSTLRAHRDEIGYGYILGGVAAMSVTDPLVVVNDDPMSIAAQQYESSTEWLIMIDCTENNCGIYRGKQGAWDLYDTFRVTTGKGATPTIRGTFSIYDHGYAFDGDVYTCYYYSCFSGPYYMHSIIYAKHTFEPLDDQIGTNASMGCVRMPLEKAQWVYENAPIGTTVVTY